MGGTTNLFSEVILSEGIDGDGMNFILHNKSDTVLVGVVEWPVCQKVDAASCHGKLYG